jgi:dihydroxyacetone kinase
MSIAGIFKEVTTITVSAWVFGDELTSLNILGVGITTIGASSSNLAILPFVAPHPARIC